MHRDRHAARGSLARDDLAALVAEDLTVRTIAERVGRSPTTVRYWLHRHGLQTTAAARGHSASDPDGLGQCPRHGEAPFFGPSERRQCARCRAEAVTRWRRRAKLRLVAEAGGACVACGYDRCVAALQFHHLDPATKRFGLGSRGLARAIEVLREEAARCALLCANCHAEVEAGLRRIDFEEIGLSAGHDVVYPVPTIDRG